MWNRGSSQSDTKDLRVASFDLLACVSTAARSSFQTLIADRGVRPGLSFSKGVQRAQTAKIYKELLPFHAEKIILEQARRIGMRRGDKIADG